eukprot:759574-Hanusia_phi.AAC.6
MDMSDIRQLSRIVIFGVLLPIGLYNVMNVVFSWLECDMLASLYVLKELLATATAPPEFPPTGIKRVKVQRSE